MKPEPARIGAKPGLIMLATQDTSAFQVTDAVLQDFGTTVQAIAGSRAIKDDAAQVAAMWQTYFVVPQQQ